MPRSFRWLAPLVFAVTLVLTTQANFWCSNYKADAEGWLFNFFSLPCFVLCTAAFCFFLSLRRCRFPYAKTAWFSTMRDAAGTWTAAWLKRPAALK